MELDSQEKTLGLAVVIHTSNLGIWETQVRRFLRSRPAGLYSETLPQNKQTFLLKY